MIDFGSTSSDQYTKILAAQFLHNELPIRLAHLVRDLKRLPHGLPDMPSTRTIIRLYEESFWRIRELPLPKSKKDERRFTDILIDIKNKHTFVQQGIAQGIQELAEKKGDSVFDLSNHLDRFYMSRISIRMLIGQHIALHTEQPGYIGIIERQCSPTRIGQDALEDAQRLCTDYYGVAPDVEILGATKLSFPYIPSHLYYILFEIFKNSMRAVAEYHADREDLPSIQFILAEGDEDIAIKISDRGGGIPRSGIDKLWSYTYTTAQHQRGVDPPPSGASVPMAGFGYGLPLSRLHAQYFGGDLQVISMEGFGTDAYIHLNKLGTVDEQLPG